MSSGPRPTPSTCGCTVGSLATAASDSLSRVAESSQVEVVVAVAVGGVLTILTIALIIIYILVTRDSALAWPWCCSSHSQHRQAQGSDISELGR